MRQIRYFAIILTSVVLLTSCGDTGHSQSGANMERVQTIINCQRKGNKHVAVGDVLEAQFTISRAYSGPSRLITLCDLDVISVQARTISTQQLDVTTTLPEQCGGLKTLTMVLSLEVPKQADMIGMCSWSQNIISPIIEADVHQVIKDIE